METFAAAVTLFLIMDPLGNIPIFLSVLSRVVPERRRRILIRELLIALALMLLFLFAGPGILKLLGLSREAISIGGGLVLMIIAIRMIFPSRGGVMGDDDAEGEPLIVPLAMPLIAGPSVLATLVLLAETGPDRSGDWLLALMGAWGVTAVILLSSQKLYKVLGARGLKAIERLMGMILVTVSVQMLLNGFSAWYVN
ncbi:MAG: YhgN family NAAT transporter [Pseudohongiella sp.]|jgi:multiple antibiotic resistance protein|nr:YhgN family NAAT transporter [Pseudohongiella sp.]MDP3515561.1 YhgN family NAAT transporter [Pseudohongiella sp.]